MNCAASGERLCLASLGTRAFHGGVRRERSWRGRRRGCHRPSGFAASPWHLPSALAGGAWDLQAEVAYPRVCARSVSLPPPRRLVARQAQMARPPRSPRDRWGSASRGEPGPRAEGARAFCGPRTRWLLVSGSRVQDGRLEFRGPGCQVPSSPNVKEETFRSSWCGGIGVLPR